MRSLWLAFAFTLTIFLCGCHPKNGVRTGSDAPPVVGVDAPTTGTRGQAITIPGTGLMDTSTTLVFFYSSANGATTTIVAPTTTSATSVTATIPSTFSAGSGYLYYLETSHGNGSAPPTFSEASNVTPLTLQ